MQKTFETVFLCFDETVIWEPGTDPVWFKTSILITSVMCGRPLCRKRIRQDDDGSGASMCPACLRGTRPLALMKSADRVPNQRVALEALDGRQVVPIHGLTGSSSNLITLRTGLGLRVLARPISSTQPRKVSELRNPFRVSASPRRCARSCSPAPPKRPELACVQAAWLPKPCSTFAFGLPGSLTLRRRQAGGADSCHLAC
jgi:hypothetical protein